MLDYQESLESAWDEHMMIQAVIMDLLSSHGLECNLICGQMHQSFALVLFVPQGESQTQNQKTAMSASESAFNEILRKPLKQTWQSSTDQPITPQNPLATKNKLEVPTTSSLARPASSKRHS